MSKRSKRVRTASMESGTPKYAGNMNKQGLITCGFGRNKVICQKIKSSTGKRIPIPNIPTNLVVTNIAPNQVKVQWTGKASGYKYKLDAAPYTSTTANEVILTINPTTTYDFTIFAYNNGTNVPAESEEATIAFSQPDPGTSVPGSITPITQVNIVAPGGQAFNKKFTWNAPSPGLGGPILRYEYRLNSTTDPYVSIGLATELTINAEDANAADGTLNNNIQIRAVNWAGPPLITSTTAFSVPKAIQDNTDFLSAIDGWLSSTPSDKTTVINTYAVIEDWLFKPTVTDMSKAFENGRGGTFGALDSTNFNDDISGWNTSNVTDMNSMFSGAAAFNQNIGGWDTSSVTDMGSMFFGADVFNNDGFALSWDTSSVTDMSSMFYSAFDFNNGGAVNTSLSPLNWDTTNVITMFEMFRSASNFNQSLSNFNTALVTNMSHMFFEASSFNQDISGWNTSAVTDMSYMFYRAVDFNQDLGGITGWSLTSIAFASRLEGIFNGPLVTMALNTTFIDGTAADSWYSKCNSLAPITDFYTNGDNYVLQPPPYVAAGFPKLTA